MRLISQDGRVDFPYEKVIVEIEPEGMKDILLSTPELAAMGQAYTVATYSDPEKAITVMQRLHNMYEKHVKASGRVLAGGKFYAPEVRFNPPKVFKFPADSEVR